MEKKLVPELRFPGFSGEWEEKTLGELATGFSYGMNASAKQFDGKNKYIRITDIDEKNNNYIDLGKVSPDGKLENKFLLEESDILFARTGASVGKTYYYKNSDGRMFFAGYLIRAKVREEYSYKYIFYNTLTNRYNNWVKIMSARSGQPGINSKEYSSYIINVPSIEEQTKIADFFTLIDKKIEKQEEKVMNLEEYKKGMMQKIFSQEVRFKDDNGEDYPEWEEKKLTKVVDRIITRNSNNESKHVLTISAEMGLIDQEEYFTKRVASKNLNNYYLISKNDFAYNKSYSKGYPYGTIKKLTRYEKGVLSSLYICFRAKTNNHMYLEHYFETTEWHKEIYTIAVEGARNHGLLNIGLTEFFNIKIKYPSIEEQINISNFLTSIDSKIEKEAGKLESLKELKKGLMQKMFI